jgi:hypothetical protein
LFEEFLDLSSAGCTSAADISGQNFSYIFGNNRWSYCAYHTSLGKNEVPHIIVDSRWLNKTIRVEIIYHIHASLAWFVNGIRQLVGIGSYGTLLLSLVLSCFHLSES